MSVTIIGGGISGLVLALTLHKHSIKCTVYELRETADIANPGAIGLAPNGLRPLDKLGLYNDVLARGWPIKQTQIRSDSDELLFQLESGGVDRYGYDTVRIVRRRLHEVLLSAVKAAGIDFIAGKKFSHVVSASPSSISFAFTDGTEATSTVLVGADGIHSTVRNAIIPDITPEYKGSLTLAALNKSNPLLELQDDPDMQTRLHSVNITRGAQGAFIAITQSADGREISMGLDRPHPAQSREEWDALLSDRDRQFALFTEGREHWPPLVQQLMRDIRPEHMYRSWPFYAIPDLEQWSTPDRNVILVGDAAHAIPPSAGQGACMAIEDAWSLGLVLSSCLSPHQSQQQQSDVDGASFRDRVVRWQTERRTRVGVIREVTKQMGNARLPPEMRKQLDRKDVFDGVNGDGSAFAWLYNYDFQL